MSLDQRVSTGRATLIEERGPWPFVTRRVIRTADQQEKIWSSRHHRKHLVGRGWAEGERLASILLRCLWMPNQLNWWIGVIFAIGSLCFAVASLLSLSPWLARTLALDSTAVNSIYFIGSIPFTLAAYLQLWQAANAGEFSLQGNETAEQEPRGDAAGSSPAPNRSFRLIGWFPHRIGWLSCALQFVGTVLFNINTFDAMLPSISWFQQDLLVWVPNIVGSILFLASGHLAFIECCHAHWAWKPRDLSWWIVFVNLLGCIGFIVSALLAIVLPGAPHEAVVHLSVLATLLGAIGFLMGSLLMLPEALAAE